VYVRERRAHRHVLVRCEHRLSQADAGVAIGARRNVEELLFVGRKDEGVLPFGRLAPLARRRTLLEQHRRRRVAQVVRVRQLLQRHVGDEVAAHNEHIAAHHRLGSEERLGRAGRVRHDDQVNMQRPAVLLGQERFQVRRDRLDGDDDRVPKAAPLEVAERQRDKRPVGDGKQRLGRVFGQW
jgi:hypothetical protein